MQDYRVQRRHPRHAISVPLEMEKARTSVWDGGPTAGLTIEISEGGFSTMLASSLGSEEPVTATFELPSAGRVWLNAVVRNKNLFRYDFEFIALSDAGQEQIKQACEALALCEGNWH